jgi:hypothetical protein
MFAFIAHNNRMKSNLGKCVNANLIVSYMSKMGYVRYYWKQVN